MSGIHLFLWMILPYMVATLFIVVLIVRIKREPFTWTSKSSEFLEKRWLRWGSLLFHWGILFVFMGHVAGLLVPVEVYRTVGIRDEWYHMMAVGAGGIAGLAAGIGALILFIRRLVHRRLRRTTSRGDWVSIILLLLVIIAGMSATAMNGLSHSGFDYRETISPWIRGVILFQPDPSLMLGVPLPFQIHILSAFGLFAVWPFTRLVHAFSFPFWYLWRSYVLYRRREGRVNV